MAYGEAFISRSAFAPLSSASGSKDGPRVSESHSAYDVPPAARAAASPKPAPRRPTTVRSIVLPCSSYGRPWANTVLLSPLTCRRPFCLKPAYHIRRYCVHRVVTVSTLVHCCVLFCPVTSSKLELFRSAAPENLGSLFRVWRVSKCCLPQWHRSLDSARGCLDIPPAGPCRALYVQIIQIVSTLSSPAVSQQNSPARTRSSPTTPCKPPS